MPTHVGCKEKTPQTHKTKKTNQTKISKPRLTLKKKTINTLVVRERWRNYWFALQ